MLLLFFFSHCNKNSFVIVPSRFLCYNALVLNYLYPHLLELPLQGVHFSFIKLFQNFFLIHQTSSLLPHRLLL
nr:MAG TPA: hypothetical protein [Caudoviricetes sp.]